MQINGYSNSMVQYNRTVPQNRAKNAQGFSQAIQDTQSKAVETSKLTAQEEMEVFKKEIHNEISQIYGKGSSAILSNSIHVTDGAFEKMKNDPAFKNKVMSTFREDAAASYLLPYQVHTTTTITEDGVYSYGANVYPHDSATTKSSKKDEADKKAEGAFYRYEKAPYDNPVDYHKIRLQKMEQQEKLSDMQLEKALSQQVLLEHTYLNGVSIENNSKTRITSPN